MSIINFHVCYTCCNNIIPTFLYIEDTLLEGCTNNNQLYDNVLSYIKKNIHPSFYYCHRCCQGLDSYLYFSNICYNNMNLFTISKARGIYKKIIKSPIPIKPCIIILVYPISVINQFHTFYS